MIRFCLTAIHRVAGPQLRDYCKSLNGCEIGDAKITPGFNLKAKFIIHTVGPVWNSQYENLMIEKLSNCYENSLKICEEKCIKSVAFPCISTGIYGFPKDKAAQIAFDSITKFIKKETVLEKIYFCCFLDDDYFLYQNLLKNHLI